MNSRNLYRHAKQCLDEKIPARKVALVFRLASDWNKGLFSLENDLAVEPILQPGRPEHPLLVDFISTPRRGLGSPEGIAAFVHAIAHIEFNAINLGLDAVYRFRGLPIDFYSDWIRVASEEAKHFSMLVERLDDLGYQYGAFEAHNGLWEMALLTENSLLERMALVPRLLEARGLDVTPRIMERLKSVGDTHTVEILSLILAEEIGHVAIGSRWYLFACQQKGLNAEQTFRKLLIKYGKIPLPTPLNEIARLDAGFSKKELEDLCKPLQKD